MTIERGIRRVLVVLSGLIVVAWGVLVLEFAKERRWAYSAHSTTIEAWCDPARRSIYTVNQPAEDAAQAGGWNIPGCVILEGPGKRSLDRVLNAQAQTPHVVVRSTEFRWFRSYLVPVVAMVGAWSLATLGLVWGAFYVLRWVVLGFRP